MRHVFLNGKWRALGYALGAGVLVASVGVSAAQPGWFRHGRTPAQPLSAPVGTHLSPPVTPPHDVPVGPGATIPGGPPATTPVGPGATIPGGPPATTPVGPGTTIPGGPPTTIPPERPPLSRPVGPPGWHGHGER